MRLPPNYGPQYTGEFERAFAEVAKRHGAALLPFLFEDFGGRRDLFQPDGIHPTEAAQPVMLESVWKRLRPLLK
jgi:acyl-CoA thioesterase-1